MQLRLAVALLLSAAPALAAPVGTTFTYQGRLADAGNPANGPYDLRFALFDASTGGAQVGPTVMVDDVSVSDGLFTVSLDFGAAAFGADARWLEVAARPGASTGAFTTLAGRQALTPSPFAMRSETTPWAGVAGKPAGFADNVDNDSGGTVTSVATGAGLSGGPVTGSGTIAVAAAGITTGLLADGAVTSPKIANGAVGLPQIDQAQVQARVGGACPVGSYLRGIHPDGTVLCTALPNPHSSTALDTSVGEHVAVAIGTDGLPVIAYSGTFGNTLRVLKCGNAACSLGNVRTTVDAGSQAGSYPSIVVPPDGRPVVSYFDGATQSLKVARCGNAACSSGNTIATASGPGGAAGFYNSIVLGDDGRPVISYRDQDATRLMAVKCGNLGCTNPALNVVSVLDDAADVGFWTSIGISGGLPVVAYWDVTNRTLKVARCAAAACNTGATVTTVDDPPVNDVGAFTSLAIGTDGFPVISYWDTTAGALKVVKCGSLACNNLPANVITTVDGPPSIGARTSLRIGADGNPVIGHAGIGGPRVTRCGDAGCTSGNTSVQVADGSTGVHLAVGADGLPLVAHTVGNSSAASLGVVKCGNPGCN